MPNVSTATPIETETLANGYSPTVGRGAVTKAGSRRLYSSNQCEIEARAPLGAGPRRHDRAADGSNCVVDHRRMRLRVIKLAKLNALLIARMSRWMKSGRMSVSKLVRSVITPRRIFIAPFLCATRDGETPAEPWRAPPAVLPGQQSTVIHPRRRAAAKSFRGCRVQGKSRTLPVPPCPTASWPSRAALRGNFRSIGMTSFPALAACAMARTVLASWCETYGTTLTDG